MLAKHTHSLDQVALGFIRNGEIIPLAALLLVAPFTSGDFETIKSYTNIQSIASLAIHGQTITPAIAAALIYTFEMDGDKLTSKFNNPQEGPAQAAEGDQSFVHGLIPQSQNRFFQVPKGGQSFANRGIQQIGSASSARWLFSKSSRRTSVNEMGCDDSDEIRTFCNNNDDATKHLKSSDARQVNLTYMCLLHRVFDSLVKYDYLSKWSPGQSLVKLILLLFLQRESKPALKCAQLLAKRTNSVNQVALKMIQQGELTQLAGLLLVAHKKAMEPFDSGNTIKEATSMENVVLLVSRGESVTATMSAAGMFELFQNAGDALAEYWSIHNDEHEPVEVIFEVVTRMRHSGIQVLATDVDLTDVYSTSSDSEMLKAICEWLGVQKGDTSGLSQISRKSPFPSVTSVKEMCHPPVPDYPWFGVDESSETSFEVGRKYRWQGFDNLGTRAYSTSTRIVDSVSQGASKYSSPSPLVRNLAYFAMKLKRGVRLV